MISVPMYDTRCPSCRVIQLDDSQCFTIAQVDRVLEDGKYGDSLSPFDLESLRNRLIDRMRNRILINTCQFNMSSWSRYDLCMLCLDDGMAECRRTSIDCIESAEEFTNYRRACDLLVRYLSDMTIPLEKLKFVFSTESVTAKFYIPGSDCTISLARYFYDMPNKVFMSVMHVDKRNHAHSMFLIDACSQEKLDLYMMFLKECFSFGKLYYSLSKD